METPERRLSKEPSPDSWDFCFTRGTQWRFKQTDAGLEISVMRAQRIYNNRAWPNTVAVKLENVEFVKNAAP